MDISSKSLNASQHPGIRPGENGAHDSVQVLEKARADTDTLLKELGSQLNGLSEAEADSRLKQVGSNEIAREKRQSALMRLLSNIKNPLVLLLTALGVRGGKEQEVSLKMLVPGDIIRLAAGDMVPADVRVLSAKDLFLNQMALTGEALPVEKKAAPASAEVQNPLDLPNLCFLGSNIESGSATAVVIQTGDRTYLGSLAASIVGQRSQVGPVPGMNDHCRRG